MHNINYVLDLETFASSPRAMIRSAAIVLFTKDGSLLEIDQCLILKLLERPGGVVLSSWKEISPSMWGGEMVLSEHQPGREVDPQTMLWWMQQGEEARAAFVASGAPAVHPMHFLELLAVLAEKFIGWAKPQSFEMPIINDLARTNGGVDILHRRRFRDARSYYAAAADTLGWEVFDELPSDAMGALHRPLYDAALTARTIQRAYREIVGRRCDP